jgi:hypothetical protein
MMIDKVSTSTFSPYLNERFRMCLGSAQFVELDLAEISEASPAVAKAATAHGRRAPFSLFFRGPMQPIMPQRIYTLEHPELGRFEIFLVPIGPDGTGMRYEAVFN